MLIRSQDKENLVNFRNVPSLLIVPTKRLENVMKSYAIAMPFSEDDSLVLGYYSKHEQCLEILDEIETFYADKMANRLIYQMPSDDGVIWEDRHGKIDSTG